MKKVRISTSCEPYMYSTEDDMTKLYKIQHIPTGKFLRIKLEKEGIKVWKEKGVIEGKSQGFGKVLFDSHKGWKTPPNPTNDDFKEINCRIVTYNVTLNEEKQ